MTDPSGAARSSWAACRRASSAWLICVLQPSRAATRRRITQCKRQPDFLPKWMACRTFLPSPSAFPERYRNAIGFGHERTSARLLRPPWGDCLTPLHALLGFTREVTFEGQAAIWLEQLARSAPLREAYPFPFIDGELDFRPLLLAVAHDRVCGRDVRKLPGLSSAESLRACGMR